MPNSNDTARRVRDALPIARYFEECLGVRFQGSGEQVTGKCPWHDDEHASLSVNRKQGLWHCHGACVPPTGGDLFTAVEKQLGCGFAEALEWAAGQAGVKVEPLPRGDKPPLAKAVGEFHRKLRQSPDAMAWLTAPDGKRGLNLETIVRFDLGWDGEFYSIPLRDERGNLVNLKMVHPDKTHQPRMKFFVKGKSHPWFPAVTFREHSELIAVGGEWDTMAMQQHGFPNAVCWVTGESGLTAALAKEAKGKRVTLLLDADEAGRAATRKSATVLAQAGAAVLLVDWTAGEWGKDATDFLMHKGADSLREILAQAHEPVGGTASMGGYVYWEGEDGYYRQRLGKDESAIRLTNFLIRQHAIWVPQGEQTEPSVEGVFIRGSRSASFHWPARVFTEAREFRSELPRVVPDASYSIHHLPELLPLLSQFNEGCPVYSSVTGPGYAGDSFVTPSVIVRQGKVVPNRQEIQVRNDSPAVLCYDLEMPPENRRAALDAMMMLLSVHDYRITVRIMAHYLSAPVLRFTGGAPYCLYISGPTGAGKTMLAKCMLNLFAVLNPMAAEQGKLLSAHSTVTSLEITGWHVKDAPVVIDDLKAGVSDMAGIARVIHSHYDAWGRSRAKASLELHQTYFVRGLLVVTGEQLPNLKGHASVIRRGLIVEVPPDGLNLDAAARIWNQNKLLRGLTAAWIAWSQMAPPPPEEMPTPPSTAERFAQQTIKAWNWFLDFCEAWGMDVSTASGLRDIAREAFRESVKDSEQEQSTSQAHTLFLNSVREGLASGRLTLKDAGAGQRRIGCEWKGHVALFPGEVVRWTKETTDLDLTPNMMGRALKAQGMLILGDGDHPTTPISFGGRAVRMWVMHDTVDLVEAALPMEGEDEDTPFADA